MANGLDGVRDRVLTENTAQAVFKHLDHFEDNRQRFETRWVWELLQNARDAAPAGGVEVEVRLENDELRFRHNGRPFAPGNITHLIYHGSTKATSADSVGHFGSGFLSTHLLSRIVHVSGQLDSGEQFRFALDRSGADAESLRRSMDESWGSFNASLNNGGDQRATTEFVYQLDENGTRCGRAGLDDLRRCAALVLAFSPEIRRITIDADGHSTVERVSEEATGNIVRVACRGLDGESTSSILVEGDAEVQSAILLNEVSGGRLAALTEDMPRVFILFPLIGTSGLKLPGVVNSRVFKPHEDRNGLVLDGETDGARRNRAALEAATVQMIKMLDVAAEEHWLGIPNLLSFHGATLPEWANAEWLSTLVAPIVKHARTIGVLKTTGGSWITPECAWIPTAVTVEAGSRLWALTSALRESDERLPLAEEQEVWSRNLVNWARLLKTNCTDFREAWTIAGLATTVASAKSLDGLTALLREGESVTEWLTDFLSLVHETGSDQLLDTLEILPSQTGRLRNRADLRVAESIANELKDIGAKLDLDIRESLLHEDVNLPENVRLAVRTEAEVVGQVVDRLKQCCREQSLDSSLLDTAVSLMWWLSEREHYRDRLDGLPVATFESGEGRITTVELRKAALVDRAPLAPAAVWPEQARAFAALFPARMVLADRYAEARSGREVWQPLAARGFVRLSPLYETDRRMETFLPDLPLPDLQGGARHRATGPTRVSAVAGLEEGESEILERARKARKSALELARFVLGFLLSSDAQAFEAPSVLCECGKEHRLYRGAWLVSLRDRAWIPPIEEGHGSERPTAESLARLLKDEPELVKKMSSEQATPLLHALGISPADFALRSIAEDEPTRVSLIHAMSAISEAAGGDLVRIEKLAEELRENPDVLKVIETHRVERQRVLKNQGIGKLVEDLLRDALKGEGLTVKRKPVGSDFEVSSDFVEGQDELWLEVDGAGRSTLLEVKATSGDVAKMTPKQAETACGQSNRFALCVVSTIQENPTADQVRDNCKFVFTIGDHLRPLWSEFESIRDATDSVRQRRGAVELEMVDGQTRFRVDRELWGTGLDFRAAVERLAAGAQQHERVGVPTAR